MHKGPITAVLSSADNKTVYTAGYDKAIYVWNRIDGTGELLGVHNHLINSLALSENGRYLASASSDYTIRLYDLETRTLSRVLYGHADDVESLAFAEHDTLLVSTSRDRRALVWDLNSGAIRVEYHGHSKDVLSLWVKGDRAFTTGDDGRALIWSIKTGETLGEIGPFDCELDAVSGSLNLDAFAIGADDGRVMVFDAETLELRTAIDAHERGVKKVAFSPSGRYLLTAGYDHRIKIWSTDTGELKQEMHAYKYQWERSLSWSSDEKAILGASFGVRYLEWDLETGEMISPPLELATPSINDVAVSDLLDIATASDDGRFRVGGEDLGMVNGTLTNGVGISADGRYVMWGDHASEVHLLDRKSDNKISTLVLGSGPVNSVSYCPEDSLFYIGTYGGHVHQVDPQDMKELYSLQAHDGAVKAVQADGRYVLTCSSDNSIHLFDKNDLSLPPREFVGPTAIVNDIFLDTARERIVSVSRDKVVRIFDLNNGHVAAQHDVHRYSIKSVTVNASGQIVSGDYWGHVVLWNPEQDLLTAPIRIASNGISALRAYGDSVYAASYDGGVYKLDEQGNREEVLRLFEQEQRQHQLTAGGIN
jgi:toxoflavin biosynthesis protein ToxC